MEEIQGEEEIYRQGDKFETFDSLFLFSIFLKI
jgi:hypothetical protein